MEISLPVYLSCLGGMVVLTIGIAIRAFINWQRPGARTLGFLMLSMAAWAGFYALEIMHPFIEVKITARKLLYLGMQMSPALWLGFALRYTGVSAWWSQRGRVFLLAAPGMLAVFLGATNEHHRLIWKSILAPSHHPGALILEYGTGFWIFAFTAYGLIVISLAVYLFVFLRSDRNFRVKTGIILTGALVTSIVSIFFLLGKNPPLLDPTPLSFALSAPLIAFGFFRFGLYSLLPLASTLIMDALRDAVIVVNDKDHVTDGNLAAKNLLGVENISENTSVFDILPQADLFREVWQETDVRLKIKFIKDAKTHWYEAKIIPLYKSNRDLMGRMIVFHDITTEQIMLKEEQRRADQLALLEETGRRIAGSFDETEILQRAVDAIIQRFGYAEAAIALLTKDNMLETTVIAGTADFGYRPGFQQPLGVGIIGHTAAIQKTYVTDNVVNDPYYFSSEQHFGSAVCTPIWKDGKVYGVLYVESLEPGAFDVLDIKTLETLSSQISESLQRAALYDETQRNIHILSVMQDISKTIAGSLEMETIASLVVNGLRDAFGYTHVSIYLLEDEFLQLAAEVGYPPEMIISKIHVSQGVNGRAIRTKTVQFIEDITKDSAFLKADNGITSEICIPLLKEGNALGTLNVESDGTRKLTQADLNLLVTIAGQIALAVDNARLHAQIKKLATTDAVTGLANRHVFEQALSAEIERARRQDATVSLIIFDIDSFKEYNDSFGHPAGDARLKAVAEIVRKNLRKYDVAARYGGDEFAIILSNSNHEQALAFAQRLSYATRDGAPQPPVEGLGVPGYTLSMGIAAFPQDAGTHEQLLIAADNAALRAKHLGKNRIQLANNSPSK
jgi:diguanylate cyclase (GGDEF)-like protein